MPNTFHEKIPDFWNGAEVCESCKSLKMLQHERLVAKFGLDKAEICMVGDRLDTDILFGKNGGLRTMLVLTGVTSEDRLLDESNSIQPDLYTEGLKDLLPAAQALAE